MNRSRQIFRYLQYFFNAKGTKAFHTSSLFELAQIFEDQRMFYAFTEIENIRQKLLINSEKIEVVDFGAGSKHLNPTSRKISDIASHTAIPPKYGRLLFKIVNQLRVKKILEVGTGLGIGTMYLASAAKKVKVITMEGSDTIADLARQNFSALNLENIRLKRGKFEDTLPGILNELEKIDLIFLDGHHNKKATLHYFESFLPFLNKTSIVILDDINWSNEMYEAWTILKEHNKVRLSINLFRMGIFFFDEIYPRQHLQLRY